MSEKTVRSHQAGRGEKAFLVKKKMYKGTETFKAWWVQGTTEHLRMLGAWGSTDISRQSWEVSRIRS